MEHGNSHSCIYLAGGAGTTSGVMAPQRIYVFGNIVGFLVSSNQNYAYDPATNSWTSGAPMPYDSVSLAVAVVNDLVYVMGDGQNVEQYTPIGYYKQAFQRPQQVAQQLTLQSAET